MNGQDPQDKERVQRNVAKMRAAGAPESDVLAYLQQEDSGTPAPAMEPTVEPGRPARRVGVVERALGSVPLFGPAFQAAQQITGGAVPGMMRANVQGATLGTSDELRGILAALGASLPGGQSPTEAYQAGRDTERQALSQFAQEHPVAAPLSEVAGAAMIPLGPLGQSLRTGRLLARVGKGAAAGAGLGGAYGFGAAEGTPEEQLAQAMRGVRVGAVVGGALPGAVAGAKATGQTAAKVGRWFGITTNTTRDKAARKAIEAALERTGQTMDDLRPRAEAALVEGRNPTLLEVLGPGGEEVLATMGPLGNEAAGRAFSIGAARKAGDLSDALISASQRRPGIHKGIPSPYFKGAWAIRGADVLRNRAARREAEALLEQILQPVQGPGLAAATETGTAVAPRVGPNVPTLAQTLPAEIQAAVRALKQIGTADEAIPQALGRMRFSSPEANATAQRMAGIEIVPPTPIPQSGPVGTSIEAAPQKVKISPEVMARKQRGPTKAQLAYHEARMAARRAGRPAPPPPGTILAERMGQAPSPPTSEADMRAMAEYLANPANLNQPGVLEMLLRLSIKP